MSACFAPAPGGAFLGGLLGYIDCQAQGVGEGGYRALAAGGSSASIALGVALTLFVALIGYRMILGETPGVREGVVSAVKIGVVLVLATSWPAFRTLAYDVVLRGPAQLAGEIGAPADLPGASGGLVTRLQAVDVGLVELVTLGAGRPPDVAVTVRPGQTNPDGTQRPAQASVQQLQVPRWDPQRDAALLGNGRTLFMTGAVAAFGAVRLIGGLLLALGPLFALFLLFDATRALFWGWVRGLAGVALGAVGTSVVLGVELAVIEPWLATVLATRRAEVAMPSVPGELIVLTLAFALVLLAVLIATARLAYAVSLPGASRQTAPMLAIQTDGVFRPTAASRDAAPAPAERSRATAVAEAVATTQRRELAAVPPAMSGGSAAVGERARAAARTTTTSANQPLGNSFRRGTARRRVSAGAGRRDRTR